MESMSAPGRKLSLTCDTPSTINRGNVSTSLSSHLFNSLNGFQCVSHRPDLKISPDKTKDYGVTTGQTLLLRGR